VSVTVAVLGLGEAGRAFAAGLAARATVIGFDPAIPAEPRAARKPPYSVAGAAADAVSGADLVIALTTAAHAASALASALGHAAEGAVYADLSTSSPAVKRELAEQAAGVGLAFADGAVMAPVPRHGIATPLLASGPGAGRFAELAAPLGMNIEVIGPDPGAAAARKLLRSLFMKGLTAVLIESLRAAEKAGLTDWFWPHVTEALTDADAALARRLVDGTGAHSARRVHEMEAAAHMVEDFGERPTMAYATLDVLTSVAERGVPRVPRQDGAADSVSEENQTS
jgi:3-hydroxyisobutyrate dehydrogenase-like beta-hydroxyacid dehydrogenase